MEISIFTDKSKVPTDNDLKTAISTTFLFWNDIKDYVYKQYPNGVEDWNYPGSKYGWSFRIKDKKRAIIYFLPRDGFFKVAFVFGQKAMDKILESDIKSEIVEELKAARVYGEGRGIRIDIKAESDISDVKKLIDIKLTS